MASQVTPTTGGIRKKNAFQNAKLDFNVVDLAPALDKTPAGESRASYIENMRKQYDGSYVKRPGTKNLFNMRELIIGYFGEDS